jgi:hypothetical protein
MNYLHRIRRAAAALGTLAGVLLLALAASPAHARILPPDGPAGNSLAPPPVIHVVTGGMPGWQITLIAIGAALAAAVLAVLADRARSARRHPAHAAT